MSIPHLLPQEGEGQVEGASATESLHTISLNGKYTNIRKIQISEKYKYQKNTNIRKIQISEKYKYQVEGASATKSQHTISGSALTRKIPIRKIKNIFEGVKCKR